MFALSDAISLVLYCAQQLGVTLGVGAQTILLVAYVQAMRDGIIDQKETQFARATSRLLTVGLVLIIVSGLGITALHFLSGEAGIIATPAYLFKWVLIVVVSACAFSKKLSSALMLGVAGGSWYALFLVHILAPVAGWIDLLTLYVAWMAGFFICWEILAFATRGKPTAPGFKPAIEPRLIVPPPVPPPMPPIMPKPVAPAPPPPPKPVPPPAPKPVAPAPASALSSESIFAPQQLKQTLPQPDTTPKPPAPAPAPAPAAPAPAPEEKAPQNPWLPTIKIMPKTAAEAKDQHGTL